MIKKSLLAIFFFFFVFNESEARQPINNISDMAYRVAGSEVIYLASIVKGAEAYIKFDSEDFSGPEVLAQFKISKVISDTDATTSQKMIVTSQSNYDEIYGSSSENESRHGNKTSESALYLVAAKRCIYSNELCLNAFWPADGSDEFNRFVDKIEKYSADNGESVYLDDTYESMTSAHKRAIAESRLVGVEFAVVGRFLKPALRFNDNEKALNFLESEQNFKCVDIEFELDRILLGDENSIPEAYKVGMSETIFALISLTKMDLEIKTQELRRDLGIVKQNYISREIPKAEYDHQRSSLEGLITRFEGYLNAKQRDIFQEPIVLIRYQNLKDRFSRCKNVKYGGSNKLLFFGDRNSVNSKKLSPEDILVGLLLGESVK